MLGGIEAHESGEPLDLGPARQQTVLAALLMDANRTVSTDQLVHRVWGDAPPRRARGAVYSYLSRLRRLLPGPTVDISRRSGGYAVVVDAMAVDVHRFRRLLDRARRTDDDQDAAATFRRALASWRGEPFAGADTPWFNAAREALARDRQAAELDCVDVRLRLGEHAALLTALSERSAAHPLDERLAAQYMLALYRCGRQADSLARYRRVRATLAEELGIDPGTELRHLHQLILAGSPELNPRSTVPVALRPPEPAWQVQCQLPSDVPVFAGRAAVIRHLEEVLTGAVAAPVILSGSPGVGKSALAVHLGHRLRAAFPDGQLYVRLSGTGDRPRDPAEVLAALLRTCGQEPHTIPEPLDDRAAAFRSRLADRRVLLVLDQATDAEQVRPLLPGTSDVAVLVTSRSDLRGLAASHSARIEPVEVLTPAGARALLAGTLGPERVGDEPEAADRLAALCAHLPLALRIAAANLAARPGRSLHEYAAELAGEGRLAKLSITGDPQAAVRTAFDHAYAALEPDTARLFSLLGLHPGPDFTAGSAASLLDAPLPVAERLLDRLVTAGLARPTAAGRYQFHDLLRLYAAQHATAGRGRAAA